MEAFQPTVAIAIQSADGEQTGFRLLQLTVNPIFFLNDSQPRYWLFPLPEFEVWMELVLGHDNANDASLPQIMVRFNGANDFTEKALPWIADSLKENSRSLNLEIYSHFYESAVPGFFQAAYGVDAEKHDSTKAGLAFYRANYRATDDAHDMAVKGRRLNYPCTYRAERSRHPGGVDVTILPRPFHPTNLMLSLSDLSLSRNESISLWVRYPYLPLKSAQDRVDRPDQITFYQRIVVSQAGAPATNYFPRIPFRYEIKHSAPPLSIGLRFADDFPAWQARGRKESAFLDDKQEIGWLPTSSGGALATVLSFRLKDNKMDGDRRFTQVMIGLFIGLLLRTLSATTSVLGQVAIVAVIVILMVALVWVLAPRVLLNLRDTLLSRSPH